jgi:hypothetical protein
MKPLSRRSVTTGLAAAVTAIPAVGLGVGAKDGSKLQELITAHRAAYKAFGKAIDASRKWMRPGTKPTPTVTRR